MNNDKMGSSSDKNARVALWVPAVGPVSENFFMITKRHTVYVAMMHRIRFGFGNTMEINSIKRG
jgi:hypothetical protein